MSIVNKLSRRGFVANVAMLCAALGCGTKGKDGSDIEPAEQGKKVRLALNWSAEAEHGGYYAALAEGYFREEGLDVTIVPGGPQVPVIQNVASGQAMFGVAVADQILQGRAAGAKVVALFAPLQESPRCILVHEESGITTLEELKDVTLAVRPGITFFKLMQKRLPLTNVKVVNYSGNVAQFLLDKRYAQQAYVFSEPFVAGEQGAKVRTLMVSQLGYNPYTSLLFTRDQLVAENRELVDKMTRACQRGWQKYLEAPTSANRLIREANPEMSEAALAFGAKALAPLCLPDGMPANQLGNMTRERWEQLEQQLIEIGALEQGQSYVAEAFPQAASVHD